MAETIVWDRKKLDAFKREYKRAVAMDKNIFIFEGNLFVRNYAKYLIQYLESVLK